MAGLDEDAIDEVLYLARANESAELEAYVSELSAQTKRSKADVFAAAIDPYSKNSALHYAAANGHTDIIKLIFSTSAEKPAPEFLNAVNEAGNTPLHWAALNGHLESVKVLIHSGADVTIINRAGHDAVYEAEINDKSEVVDWLLGAVEELERGVGQGGQAEAGEDMEEDVGEAGVGSAEDKSALAEGSGSVESVEKKMEHLST